VVGCGANVTVEISPNPAVPGQPVEVTVTVENTLECQMDDVLAQVFIVAEGFEMPDPATTSGFAGSDDLAGFCEILADPTLLLCELSQDLNGEFPLDLAGPCCEMPEFSQNNPELCATGTATLPFGDAVRDVIIARARALGLPVDEILADQSGAATSGTTTNCSVITEEPGFALLGCDFGDIPAGATATGVGSFTPTLPGQYYAFVFAEADATCADGTFPGGTDCAPFAVGLSTMAPAMSPIGLVALALALIAIGVLAIRFRTAP
jgi:hypothetical protein